MRDSGPRALFLPCRQGICEWGMRHAQSGRHLSTKPPASKLIALYALGAFLVWRPIYSSAAGPHLTHPLSGVKQLRIPAQRSKFWLQCESKDSRRARSAHELSLETVSLAAGQMHASACSLHTPRSWTCRRDQDRSEAPFPLAHIVYILYRRRPPGALLAVLATTTVRARNGGPRGLLGTIKCCPMDSLRFSQPDQESDARNAETSGLSTPGEVHV